MQALPINFTPFNYYHVCRKIKSIPWCLSIKRRQGRIEYYRQYSRDGIRHQDYIRKADVPEALRIYNQKKRCVAVKQSMDRIIRSMPKPVRHEIMCQLKVFREIDADKGQISRLLDQKKQTLFYSQRRSNLENSPVTLDGTLLDSKSEVICYNIASKAGLIPTHNVKVFTDFENSNFYRTVDLSFWIHRDPYGIPVTDARKAAEKRQIFHEHLGMLENPEYRKNQLTKLKEYRRNGISCGDNLIITAPHSSNSEQSILKQYVVGRLISGSNALHLLRTAKKQKWGQYI